MSHTPKTWFLTGASRGFGRQWATAALERGDRVAGTARNASTIEDLKAAYPHTFLPLELNVDDRAADFDAVRRAAEHFGRLDVVVNNAGYGQFGMLEELTEAEVRAQFETNFFGAVWVTQAALPILRAQGGGHVIQVSSIGGISALPNVGIYNSSKWALEGISQALAREVAEFGIRVTLVEPGAYATDWGGVSARHATELPAYAASHRAAVEARAERVAEMADPRSTREAILAIVDAAEPPLRFLLGQGLLNIARVDYESRLAEWEAWNHISVGAQAGG
jgi:NAD(P)-dependent dehydrogenase (short-subunit alcohol dehydrogenase family)